jgi:dCTP deaminase
MHYAGFFDPGFGYAGAGARDQIYGQGIGSNYQAQSPKLSKHFRA